MEQKMREALNLLQLHELTTKLAAKAQDALLEARHNLNHETLLEAHRALSEWQMCYSDFRERMEKWENS